MLVSFTLRAGLEGDSGDLKFARLLGTSLSLHLTKPSVSNKDQFPLLFGRGADSLTSTHRKSVSLKLFNALLLGASKREASF
jgi:hypothetical protein